MEVRETKYEGIPVVIETYGALCNLETFTINNVEADEDDFVEKWDTDTDNAQEYGCGSMQAFVLPVTENVLKKYGIMESVYIEIAEDVAEALSFGACGWCT